MDLRPSGRDAIKLNPTGARPCSPRPGSKFASPAPSHLDDRLGPKEPALTDHIVVRCPPTSGQCCIDAKAARGL